MSWKLGFNIFGHGVYGALEWLVRRPLKGSTIALEGRAALGDHYVDPTSSPYLRAAVTTFHPIC